MNLIAAAFLAVSALAGESAKPVLPRDASAKELVENCRTMIPRDVELSGRIILRSRRGIPIAEYNYRLSRRNAQTDLQLTDDDGRSVEFEREGRILKTDVTWSDLTLDYLWWDDFSFDKEREGETVHGQVCSVVVMKKGERTVRVWVDRKTGAMLQAEEFRGDRAIRRLWGTRVKKFGERWMANVMEVETVGSGHRTKITVEEMK
jgi:hypothetical protein